MAGENHNLSLETQLVLRELDHLRAEISDMRREIGDLREDVSTLKASEAPKGRGIARDGGLTISAATLGSGLLWLLQHWAGK